MRKNYVGYSVFDVTELCRIPSFMSQSSVGYGVFDVRKSSVGVGVTRSSVRYSVFGVTKSVLGHGVFDVEVWGK